MCKAGTGDAREPAFTLLAGGDTEASMKAKLLHDDPAAGLALIDLDDAGGERAA